MQKKSILVEIMFRLNTSITKFDTSELVLPKFEKKISYKDEILHLKEENIDSDLTNETLIQNFNSVQDFNHIRKRSMIDENMQILTGLPPKINKPNKRKLTILSTSSSMKDRI